MSDDDLFDPYEQALMWTQARLGIITTDEHMHLIAISDSVVTDSIGEPADTLTARESGVVFWFRATDPHAAINRMATLNLFAAARMSARTVPLLCGPVLITGSDPRGKPGGLSDAQLRLLKSGPEPNWWERAILQTRVYRSQRRRSARSRFERGSPQ